MTEYRVTRKEIRYSASHKDGETDSTEDQETVQAGDTIVDPPESMLEAFDDRLEKVPGTDDDTSEETEEEETEEGN